VVQLENAYLFWSFCRVTTAILHRKYSKAIASLVENKIDDDNESSSLSDNNNVNESSNEPTNKQQSTSRPGIGSDFTCKNCNKSFPNSLYLKRHIRNVRCVENTELNQTIKSYKCKRCNAGFTKNADLRRHNRVVRCINANSNNQTINDDTSSSNLRQPAEDQQFTCKNCEKPFKTMSHLRRHNLNVKCEKNTFLSSNNNKKYKCSFCSCSFLKKASLARHKKRKHPHALEQQKDIQKPYKCVLCATRFSRLDGLVRHKRTKHPKLVKEQCEFCKQVFLSKRSLEEHDRTVHSSDNFECEFCLIIFQEKSTFFWHKRNVHPNACKICKMEFNSSTDLVVHNETHPKIHECSECEQSFTHLKDLNEHTQSTHFENIQLTCDICGKILQSIPTIKRHMLQFHLNVGYECKLCSKKYQEKRNLWVHAFKHRELQPFNCNDCSYRTADKPEFRKHLSRKHKVEYNESVHGYKLETIEEVIASVQ
jgi:uncharacterized Zn-finger protein